MKEKNIEIHEMHNAFINFLLPEKLQEAYSRGFKPLGAKNKAKLFLFLSGIKQSYNDIYNYYLQFKPSRQEGEEYNDYKNRMKFQQILAKYKPLFYNYNEYELVKANN